MAKYHIKPPQENFIRVFVLADDLRRVGTVHKQSSGRGVDQVMRKLYPLCLTCFVYLCICALCISQFVFSRCLCNVCLCIWISISSTEWQESSVLYFVSNSFAIKYYFREITSTSYYSTIHAMLDNMNMNTECNRSQQYSPQENSKNV